jgi:hypothetical protein
VAGVEALLTEVLINHITAVATAVMCWLVAGARTPAFPAPTLGGRCLVCRTRSREVHWRMSWARFYRRNWLLQGQCLATARRGFVSAMIEAPNDGALRSPCTTYVGAHDDERRAWRNAADRWRPFWSIRPSVGWHQQRIEATFQAAGGFSRTTRAPQLRLGV